MKNTITVLFATTTVALAVVCLVQSRKSATQEIQITSLRNELETASLQLEQLEGAKKRGDRQREELAVQAEELATQLRAHQLAAATPAPPAPAAPTRPERAKTNAETGGFGKMLAQMMQDPDTRELVRTQQRLAMDQLYAPLVKQMGLTADEAAQFKDLLADNMIKGAEKASSLFSGLNSSNRSEMLLSVAAEQKSFEEQVETFLGEERYALYKDYKETLSERTMLNQFKTQVGSDYNLTEPQTEALLTFMKEEKKRVAAATGLPLNESSQDPARLQTLLAEDKFNQILDAQQTINQRVYERARTILSADQLQTLGKFQINQMQMTRVGLTMARKMFGADKATAGSPAQ